jgi:hypothetical protein
MIFTTEYAECLGIRDRIMGVDAEERRITLSRFQGIPDLERAYWSGWIEADHYCGNVAKWAQGLHDRDGAKVQLQANVGCWPGKTTQICVSSRQRGEALRRPIASIRCAAIT